MIVPKTLVLVALLAAAPAAEGDDQASGPPFKTVQDLQDSHDRALVRDLLDYIEKNPKADDVEQAYMAVFNKVIDHDWFADNEPVAKRYLEKYPEGAVRPLAHIIVTMARALAGQFGPAMESYHELMRGLDKPDQEEFAVNFADSLAAVASAAGEYASAREVYEALLKQFGQSPTLRQKVRDDLNRLDRVGKPAPGFDVKDMAGNSVRLNDLKGKYTLIDFWATWCQPCVADLPNLSASYSKYHKRGFEILSVSLDETPDAVADFVKTRKVPWRQVHNASSGGDLVEAFGVTTIPATYLLGPDGHILRIDLRGRMLDRTLEKVMAEK